MLIKHIKAGHRKGNARHEICDNIHHVKRAIIVSYKYELHIFFPITVSTISLVKSVGLHLASCLL